MFSVLVRAGFTFAIVPVIYLAWRQAMNPLIDAIEGFGAEGSDHAEYLTTTVEWLPFLILISILIWVIWTPAQQRRLVGGV